MTMKTKYALLTALLLSTIGFSASAAVSPPSGFLCLDAILFC